MQEKIKINFKGKNYVSREMTPGVFVDAEKLKSLLSGSQYGGIYRMGTSLGDEALTIVDMEAYFSILFPELINDLKPKSIGELNVNDFKELRKVYRSEVTKWVNSYIKLLKEVENDESPEKGN